MRVATVEHIHIVQFESGASGFAPGTTRNLSLGVDWDQNAVVFTARPLPRPGQDRTLTVTDIRFRATSSEQGLPPDQFVHVTVRNVGMDTIFIWYLDIGLIAP